MRLENKGETAAAGSREACGTTSGARLAGLTRAMQLGATLYMPVVHPAIPAFAGGLKPWPARSVVLCLEDALHVADLDAGLDALRALLAQLSNRPAERPMLFIRPRNLEMARHLSDLPGIGEVAGFVAPKVGLNDLEGWLKLAQATALRLMPTLERGWVFDPVALSEFGDAVVAGSADRLIALRIGGNDLLAALALRRQKRETIYEGPLLSALSQAMCQLGARGLPLTAPVFDFIDDAETLAREAKRDASFGFVGKTAIHPCQIGVIEGSFRVAATELEQAREILDAEAAAVFRQDGAMAEPATHRAWAERMVARAAAYGIIDAQAAVTPRLAL
ncbi:MAG: HpcH/HpaI aldolase/citrate lyase family protein [Pseudomonadota bacterium]